MIGRSERKTVIFFSAVGKEFLLHVFVTKSSGLILRTGMKRDSWRHATAPPCLEIPRMPALGHGALKMQGQLAALFPLRSVPTRGEKNRNAGMLFSTCPVGGQCVQQLRGGLRRRGYLFRRRMPAGDSTCGGKRCLRIAAESVGRPTSLRWFYRAEASEFFRAR